MADCDVFYIKTNDTSPALRYALLPRTTDLSGATVVFNLRDRQGTVKVSRGSATVVTATGTPTVEYPWQAGDTDTEGRFYGEFEVTFGDGAVGTFPNSEEILVKISEDIA